MRLLRIHVYMKMTVIILTTFLLLRMPTHFNRIDIDNVVTEEIMYLVDTPVCRIPDLNPFDKSIINIINLTESIKCNGTPSLTFEDDNMLRINLTAKRMWYGDLRKCSYTPIYRGPEKSDSNFMWGKRTTFKSDVVMKEEFIMVRCWNSYRHEIYRNFHTFIIPENDFIHDKKNQAFKKAFSPKESLNVLMIGVDSMSRLNFMRQMRQTRRYLLDDMAAIELQGYTKVADNTFVNIVPLTTGKFLKELPWNETMTNMPMDPYGFIWKNFSNSGYRTLYAEDAPLISTFNLLKRGFHEAPTDHYFRGFNLALEKEMPGGNANYHCVGERLETDIVLNYLKQFATTFQGKPHFGYAFLARLTHDNVNDPGHADDSYHRILKKLKDSQLLNDTVLIFFSDHGTRFGQIRTTYIGKFEERMPMMFLVFPTWFEQKYPNLYRTMIKNKNKLTTPFDIHATLLDILYFKGKPQKFDKYMRGLSLFSEIQERRTCEEAGIQPHWCTCMKSNFLFTNSKLATSSGTVILSEINKKISKDTDKCAVLTLKAVISASQMTVNDDVLRFKKVFSDVLNKRIYYGDRIKAMLTIQVTIVTSPGGGMFEGTVTHDENTNEYKLAGDVSRINKYGHQSQCIENFVLQKYCFCLNK